MSVHPGKVTELLALAQQGDDQAVASLIEVVYPELRQIAAHYLRHERPGHTLQPTALVHEAYLRLSGQLPSIQNRAHFFGIAARLIRQILVEYARSRKALKRSAERVPVDGNLHISMTESQDLVALDEALVELASIDERQSRIVELRYFGGLTIAETASVLGVSEKTVKRDWTLARVWLHRAISKTS